LLDKYYQTDTKDLSTAYTLGIINFYKEDYTTSNLYFNAAILGGYTPKLELERRLIYNYALLGDTLGAFKVFRHLLSSPDATPEDYLVAIYLAEQSGEVSKARLWSLRAIEQFPQDPTLLTFASISERRSGEIIRANELLEQSLSIEANNPLALLEKARYLRMAGQYSEAQILIETLLGTTPIEYFKKEGEAE
jgi:tetratricopeptide (TPR) repeat protein